MKGEYYDVVYCWPSGEEYIHYRRHVSDTKLARHVRDLHRLARRHNQKSPYRIRRWGKT